jgi:transcriptional regulator with PAS, ATPase and Fis domain
MIRVCELAKTIASTDSTVLLQGETGTGKEVFARAVHYDSTRAASPFIVVNCAGINENLLESHLFGHVKGAFTGAFETVPGKFEVVKDGTILLDEISETSLHFQKKLLRVLEERTFERVGDTKSIRCRGRVIAATNRNLKDMVRKNEFRSDLFFRLNVVPIVLPPLRERPGDIPLLAGHFLKVYGEKFRKPGMELTPELDEILLRHSWPGNVRELEHFIEKWVLVSGEGNVEPEMLLPREHAEHAETDAPQAIPPGMFDKNFQDFMNEAENAYFRHLMERYRGDVPRMAGHADTARKTIYAKIKRHSLKLD